MELYEQLSKALADHDGFLIESILMAAKDAGVNRLDALAELHRLYEETTGKHDEVAEELVVDFMNALTFYCQPKYYIWPPDSAKS